MMKKVILTGLLVWSGMACLGVTADVPAKKEPVKKRPTHEQVQAAIRRVNMMRTGGIVKRPHSAKGWFVLIDAQKTTKKENFGKCLDELNRRVCLQTKMVSGENVTIENVRGKIASAGAKIGVAVVEDGITPALLCAPEEGWAIVNVAKLRDGNPDVVVLDARVRREVLRAFAFVAGGICALHDPLMQPVTKVSDLDAIKSERFAVMLLNVFPLSLPYYGVQPWYSKTYAVACEEGWAPAPTNEYQKAIWDKIHALPAAPLAIKPETKKVSE